MRSRLGSPSPCHHSHSTRGSRRLSPRGSRSTSTNTSVPTTMGKGPRLPRLSCARTFGCKFVQARTRSVASVLTRVFRRRFGPGARIRTLHLGPVTTWPSSGCRWTSEARIGVEATPRSQTDEHLARTLLKPLLQFHGIVACIKDEQGNDPLLLMPEAEKRFDLLGGHLIGVLPRADALHIHGGGPALADEIELCDELVSPSGHDRLPRRVARRMIVVSALGAALRVAAIPHAHVH